MYGDILLLTQVGFIISLYIHLLGKKIKQNPGYKPMCDLSYRVSCSKPILSEYGNLFGISNAIFGMFFYLVMGILVAFNYMQIVFVFSCLSLAVTCYFAYILFFKVQSLCVLCVSIYVINILIFINSR